MDFVTLMTLKLTAKEIGTDQFGNRYYEERRARAGKPPRRYVRYNGIAEASKVPADWAGCIIPNQHRRRLVAMTSMCGS